MDFTPPLGPIGHPGQFPCNACKEPRWHHTAAKNQTGSNPVTQLQKSVTQQGACDCHLRRTDSSVICASVTSVPVIFGNAEGHYFVTEP